MSKNLRIETIVNGPFMENCFLVWDSSCNKGVLIDPGAEPGKLLQAAELKGVELEGILNTHGHIDHAGAVRPIQDKLSIPFAMHPADNPILASLPGQASMFGVPEVQIPTLTRELRDGDSVTVGDCTGQVLHTPGHTPGGVCFLFDGVVFVGDTLFSGSVGRTDLPGGSTSQLLESIQQKLLVLDDDIQVYSGHGPRTTIGQERRYNPFLTGRW